MCFISWGLNPYLRDTRARDPLGALASDLMPEPSWNRSKCGEINIKPPSEHAVLGAQVVFGNSGAEKMRKTGFFEHACRKTEGF